MLCCKRKTLDSKDVMTYEMRRFKNPASKKMFIKQ